MAPVMSLGVVALTSTAVHATSTSANPIRKVVTLLQKMETTVTEEGEKETALYDKFMCWCKTGSGDLSASIEGGNTKISQLGTDIKQKEEELAQAKDDLSQAQSDRASAKTAMAEAMEIRQQEASAFAAESAEYGANIHMIVGAIGALEKGMAGAFLQSSSAQSLRALVSGKQSMFDDDRQTVLSFLSDGQTSGYTPSSGQVTGILKQMEDEMNGGLSEATKKENAAIQEYNGLMAAKTKEVNALSANIEAKLKLIGDLSIAVAQMRNELTDTEEALMADQAFLANLEKDCATRKAEWEVRVQTRADELLAIADAIKMLNDDDALELFKKTLPSASSLMQVQVSTAAARTRALAYLRGVQVAGRPQLDFIALALHGKKIGFGKVIGMIDDMVVMLKQEQMDDDNKKEYCAAQLDQTDDLKKSLERKVSDLEAAIASTEDGIATAKEDIAALEKAIRELDQSVAQATQQRQDENAEFKDLMASNTAAKELLGAVKNRLNQFYNPKLHKAAPKAELAADDRVMASMGAFAEVAAHVHKAAPPPPPAALGAYGKKSEESGGVMQLMNMLIADLDKEMTEATAEEKDSQADYETMMKDSAAKRAADSKSLTQKQSTKASLEGDLEAHNEGRAATASKLAATNQYIQSLHTECDWLLKYFDTRKEARDSEIDALGKAKAVLNGADYALVQTESRKNLRRAA